MVYLCRICTVATESIVYGKYILFRQSDMCIGNVSNITEAVEVLFSDRASSWHALRFRVPCQHQIGLCHSVCVCPDGTQMMLRSFLLLLPFFLFNLWCWGQDTKHRAVHMLGQYTRLYSSSFFSLGHCITLFFFPTSTLICLCWFILMLALLPLYLYCKKVSCKF